MFGLVVAPFPASHEGGRVFRTGHRLVRMRLMIFIVVTLLIVEANEIDCIGNIKPTEDTPLMAAVIGRTYRGASPRQTCAAPFRNRPPCPASALR